MKNTARRFVFDVWLVFGRILKLLPVETVSLLKAFSEYIWYFFISDSFGLMPSFCDKIFRRFGRKIANNLYQLQLKAL